MSSNNSKNVCHYSRDSFDRFGDDLCELLLSYLPIKDKFRFECVSKQWRRLVFNKVNHFDDRLLTADLPTDEELDVKFKHLKTILEKCHNLRTIRIAFNPKTIQWLSDNSHGLESIKLFVNEEVWSKALKTFGQKLGSKVEEFEIQFILNTKMLKWFPNLKRLYCQWEYWLGIVGNQLVPELIHLEVVSVRSHRMSSFTQLVDKYEKTLKNISVYFGKDCNISLIFQQIYRFKQLESLLISLPPTDQEFDLTLRVIALSQHCPKLSKIHLQTSDEVSISLPSKPITSIKFLSLKFRQIPNNFFFNLSLLTPNLKEFKLSSDEHKYTNEDLKGLSRMKGLKRLVLESDKRNIIHSLDDSAVIQLLDNCKELRKLEIEFKCNITLKTIDKLKEVAINRPKETIRFSTKTLPQFRGSEMHKNLFIYFM